MTWMTRGSRGDRNHAAMRKNIARAARGMIPVLSDGLRTAINRPYRARSLLDSDHRRGIARASLQHLPSHMRLSSEQGQHKLQNF